MALSSHLHRDHDRVVMPPAKHGIKPEFMPVRGIKSRVALAILGLVGLRVVSQGEITSTLDHYGQLHFRHSDSQTTAIFEYLAGRRKFTDLEQLHLAREYVAHECRKAAMETPENIDSMNFEALQVVLEQALRQQEARGELLSSDPPANLTELFARSCEALPGLYDTLWQMEAEAGAPELRWTFGDRHLALSSDDRVPFYNPFLHRITLDPSKNCFDIQSTLLSERAHAHQFEESQLGSYFAFAQSCVRVAGRALSGNTAEGLYAPEYALEGSFEHEAHVDRKRQLMVQLWSSLALALNQEVKGNLPEPGDVQ